MSLVRFINNQAPYLNAENLNNNFDELKESIDKKIPAGIINIYAGDTAPTGWLICDGSEISRTTYSDLYDVIGTTYGDGNETDTFNLPNLKGKIPVGLNANDADFDDLGETGGEKTHTLTVNEIPAHSHQFMGVNEGTTTEGEIGNYPAEIHRDTRPNWPGNASWNTGGGQAHNNLQPYIVLNYIIKY